ncbi:MULTISPECIES: DUF2339 domain-containing protein [unclassified Chelatococcus]|uniref:DUF2339 domain-containing protein n=1 Tax=unclassified Chelatococcus TaxID=2638111 RepID=UPI001BCC30F9|nr:MULTISPECIES: DUF2339 domain-containing protein [unclassified Chelatococcus]MBS7698310.1 DUF2339 domain-containing protein [Chelatococcus sp. YT9]MBX3559167.1 DUF2339 domain-containing protein [Chelatococcus sp.]
MEWVLLALLILALPIMTIASFIMALNLKQRTRLLEEKVQGLEQALALGEGPAQAPLSPGSTPEEPERPADEIAQAPDEVADAVPPEPALEPEGPEWPQAARADAADTAGSVPAPPQPGLEERLGSRWAVWVGGIALALGGFLLVRFSVEQGYFGPGVRVTGAALLALALIAVGEWFRRRERAEGFAGIPSAHVPSVLTAAGTASAFATVYASYALYDFISPATAFVLLGLVSLATLTASVLHGPALAALGLLAALVSPLLVSTDEPKPWALVIYLLFPVAASYALARLRLWKWLAVSATLGAALWGAFLVLVFSAGHAPALLTHIILQALLAVLLLVADPNRGVEDESAYPDKLGLGVLIVFAGLSGLAMTVSLDSGTRALFGGIMVALYMATAVRIAPAAGAAALAAAIAGAGLFFWPVAREALAEPQNVLPGGAGSVPMPETLSLYLTFAVGSGAAVALASLWRILRGARLPFLTIACYAGAATVGPLALLVVAYWRVAGFDKSIPFALVAAALGLAATYAARLTRTREGEAPVLALGTGAFASAAVAALALGLTFALDKGMLTVSFALAALGTAWVGWLCRIPALRYVVGAIGALVLGRVIWDPAIAGSDLGTTPILNWLLWGYGVPAVSFGLAAVILARHRRDAITQLCESLSIVFAALLVFFQIRHALSGGDILRESSSLIEAGLMVTSSLLFSLVMVRFDTRRRDPVYRIASLAFGAFSLAISFGSLAFIDNPAFSGDAVPGGAIFNGLLLGYLIPAIAAFAVAWYARPSRPMWYVYTAAGLGLFLHLLYMLLEIRRLFQGPVLSIWRVTSETELWVYSLALLAMGVLLLAIGLLWRLRLARLLSGAYILAAVLKVFLVDMANLEGALRALSFIGLGLVLVGIGLAYQKLLLRTRPHIPVPRTEPPTPPQ